ncbi:hypothetical protein E2542_SST08298 [Spatholobus suberectus]|nr:hypothetical protein E2542_SST08298 [Spatholobus suberectus]
MEARHKKTPPSQHNHHRHYQNKLIKKLKTKSQSPRPHYRDPSSSLFLLFLSPTFSHFLTLSVKVPRFSSQAELWVNNMSKDADDDRTNADLEGRPSGLGLGAKVSCQSKFVPSDDPVERKLYAKVNVEKRKTTNIAKESTTIARDVLDDDEDSEDLDSRTNAFAKRKAATPLTWSILRNKKQK